MSFFFWTELLQAGRCQKKVSPIDTMNLFRIETASLFDFGSTMEINLFNRLSMNFYVFLSNYLIFIYSFCCIFSLSLSHFLLLFAKQLWTVLLLCTLFPFIWWRNVETTLMVFYCEFAIGRNLDGQFRCAKN